MTTRRAFLAALVVTPFVPKPVVAFSNGGVTAPHWATYRRWVIGEPVTAERLNAFRNTMLASGEFISRVEVK